MSANDQIWLIFAQEFYKRARVELIEREPAAFILPGLVQFVVHPARHFGHFIDEIDVSPRIKMTEEFVGVVQHIDVVYFSAASVVELFESFLNGLRRAYMSRTSGGRQEENFVEHGSHSATKRHIMHFVPLVVKPTVESGARVLLPKYPDACGCIR